ncbi:MAG: hypothetical protein ACFE7E_00550 [Candidatus Hodarchaeota archaeon]
MPLGIILVRWDDRIGTIVEAKYPPDVKASPDLAMKIYGAHVLGERGPGFLMMKVENLNVASYYSGLELNYFVALIMAPDEDAAVFEEGLTEVAGKIFTRVVKKEGKKALKEYYPQLVRFPTLTMEQKIALIFSDPSRALILDYLTREGNSTKADLEDLLKDVLRLKAIDIDALLSALIKMGMVTTEWVEGLPTECVFMTRDAFLMRVPPKNMFEKIRSGNIMEPLASRYVDEVTEYFKGYKPNQKDIKQISQALTVPDFYDVLNSLRNSQILRVQLPMMLNKNSNDVEKVVKQMIKEEFVASLKDDDGREWLFLKANPKIITFYPEYCAHIAAEKYNNQELPSRQAMRHLVILKENYREM